MHVGYAVVKISCLGCNFQYCVFRVVSVRLDFVCLVNEKHGNILESKLNL